MIYDLFSLAGKSALVTGGSRGIGKAVARGYAEAGAGVVISARDEAGLKKAQEEIGRGLDVRVEYVVADMTDRGQVDALAEQAIERMGRIDVLFNNAGHNDPQPLAETTDDRWDRIIELNLTSCMRLSRGLVRGMIERKWGRIIYTSSVMALASSAARGSYSATKSALIGMMRAQALELGPHGITVNCLAPGPVMTDLPMNLLSKEQKDAFARRTAVQHWGAAIDMAGPVLLLSTNAGDFITGSVLVADGGMLCRTFD